MDKDKISGVSKRGKDKDYICKQFFNDNERFADLINGCLFHGEQRIKASDLKELDTESGLKSDNTMIRRRDLVKQSDEYILGIEFQSTVDSSMALRAMVYDALSYQKFMDEKKSIVPVTTLCFYTGSKRWNAPVTLHGMMGNIDEKVAECVSDYSVNVVCLKEVDLAWYHNEEVRELIGLVQMAYSVRDFYELVQRLKENEPQYEEAIKAAKILTGNKVFDDILVKKEGGGYKVCENFERILREMVAKEYPETIAENIELKEKYRLSEEKSKAAEEKSKAAEEKTREVEEMNKALNKKIDSIVRLMINHNYDIETIVRITGLSLSEVKSALAS